MTRVNLKTNLPRPESKMASLQRTIGKTIERVEWGEENNPPSIHQAESIILHFTDGTSMGIVIGSNVTNLGLGGTKKNPCPLSTDLMVAWLKPNS
jgi:hypothetical protein